MGDLAIPVIRVPGRLWNIILAPDTEATQNYARIAIKLIATTNQQMEGLLGMFCQQVDPNRVVASLEAQSAKAIWVHAGAEPIALRGIYVIKRSWCGEDLASLTEYAARRIVSR